MPLYSSFKPNHRHQQQRAVEALDHSKLPPEAVRYHTHHPSPNQCCSVVVQAISAPVPTVWSLVRRFDRPQTYKHFIKACHVLGGDANGFSVGCIREIEVVSGLPATSSRERLEVLDDEEHVMSFKIVGGEHRLRNYRSVTSLHGDGAGGTVVVESYVVDVPVGNTAEETRLFVDTIIRCNLQSLGTTATAADTKE